MHLLRELMPKTLTKKVGTKYIAKNKQYTGDVAPIAHLLPWRSKTKGVTPGMKCKFVNSKKEEEKDLKWNYPRAKPNEKENRMFQARVAEIGTRFLFQNFWKRKLPADEWGTHRCTGHQSLQQPGWSCTPGQGNTVGYS